MPPPRDTAPWMRAAGKAFTPDDGTIFAPPPPRPDTPDAIKPFRKSQTAQVGKGAIHYGIARDARAPDIRFGRKGEYSQSVGSCLKEADASGVAAVATDIAERAYQSRRKEPLGRSAVPAAPLPEHTLRPTFAFGTKSVVGEGAKGLIYAASEGKPVAKQVPGVARQRGYDWASVKIDPTQFRFGRNSAQDAAREGTTKTLVEPDIGRPTKLVPIAVAQAAAVGPRVLGKPRNLGFGDRKEGADFVYGSVQRGDEFGTRMILGGCGDKPEPDDVLGRPTCKSAILRRLRLLDPKPDESRIFGVPTLRTDLPKPRSKSSTNANNYGDDADASALLYPSAYVAGGLTNDAFQTEVDLEGARSLADRAKFELTPVQVEAAFARAKGGDSSNTMVTVSKFRLAVEELGF